MTTSLVGYIGEATREEYGRMRGFPCPSVNAAEFAGFAPGTLVCVELRPAELSHWEGESESPAERPPARPGRMAWVSRGMERTLGIRATYEHFNPNNPAHAGPIPAASFDWLPPPGGHQW